MLFKSITALSLLAATAVADLASISASLVTVDKDIAALNSSLLQYDGNLLNAIPGLFASNQLSSDLDAGTKTANASAPLSQDDAIKLVPYVQQLSNDAQITIQTSINKAPLYKKNNLAGITLLLLKDSQSKSAAFANAIIAKVPESLQPAARNLVTPINDGYAKAIAAYS